MRPVLLAVAALLILGFASRIFLGGPGGPGGWSSTTPTMDSERFDVERRALRQVSIQFSNSTGLQVTYRLTLLGPTRRVFEPWTTVTAEEDGLSLMGLDGLVTPLPADCLTVIWDEKKGKWGFSPERLDDATALPELIDGGSLPDRLRTLFPDRSALIDRAFVAAGGSG